MEPFRPSREHTNMQIAQIVSQRGTCARMQVGAVITINDKIVATGYNGPAAGEEHCGGLCDTTKGCTRAIHAERNAIKNMGKGYSSLDKGDAEVYVTHQPCYDCANIMLAMLSPVRVYYKNIYRDQSGVILLLEYGVEVFQIDQNGNTKQIQDLRNTK
jgi:dCMP deaminase